MAGATVLMLMRASGTLGCGMCQWKSWLLTLNHKLGLVDGLSVHGKIPRSCRCDVCVQAKIRHIATPRTSPAADVLWFVGQTVSTNVNSVPYASTNG
jgi:hypothetical protein